MDKLRVIKYNLDPLFDRTQGCIMTDGSKCQIGGEARDVVKILGKRLCANGEDRWQKPQDCGVLRRESPPILVVLREAKSA